MVSLPEGQSAASSLIAAMESIEGDYETLKGLLLDQAYVLRELGALEEEWLAKQAELEQLEQSAA